MRFVFMWVEQQRTANKYHKLINIKEGNREENLVWLEIKKLYVERERERVAVKQTQLHNNNNNNNVFQFYISFFLKQKQCVIKILDDG